MSQCVLTFLLIWSGAASGQDFVGRKAVGLTRAVVNFSEVASQQALLPRQEPAPILVPEGELPSDLPLPPEVAAAASAQARLAPRVQVQAPAAQAPSPAPTLTFAGLGDGRVDTALHIPPDTHGAVGPNHLMVALNNGVLVQTRSGTTAKAAVGLTAFWPPSLGASHAFDPRVLYDVFLDRWILVAVSAPQTTTSALLIGMSQTNNPTGSWTAYSIPTDQTAAQANTTPTLWGDFPNVGFNKNWVVVTLNMYTITGGTFTKGTIFAFDINGLASGATSLQTTVFNDPNATSLSPAVTLDADLSTMYMLQSYSSSTGTMRMSRLTGGVGSESYTAGPFVTGPSPWSYTAPTDNFAPQLNGDASHLINTGDGRIYNLVYRNGSLWTAHMAFLPAGVPTHTAVQWWQISTSGTVQQIGRMDDATGVNFYAYPSIAVNRQNDLFIGFTHFSGSIFAEAAYAFGPFAGSTNNLLSPFTYKAGEAFYFVTFDGTENRWGDYSATVVDPVNDMDFWTLQEYASAVNLCSTQSPTCTGGWGTWWAKLTAPIARKRLVQVTAD